MRAFLYLIGEYLKPFEKHVIQKYHRMATSWQTPRYYPPFLPEHTPDPHGRKSRVSDQQCYRVSCSCWWRRFLAPSAYLSRLQLRLCIWKSHRLIALLCGKLIRKSKKERGSSKPPAPTNRASGGKRHLLTDGNGVSLAGTNAELGIYCALTLLLCAIICLEELMSDF